MPCREYEITNPKVYHAELQPDDNNYYFPNPLFCCDISCRNQHLTIEEWVKNNGKLICENDEHDSTSFEQSNLEYSMKHENSEWLNFFIPNWSGNEDIDRIVRVLQEKITEVYNDCKNIGFENLPSNYKKTFSITT